MISENIASIGVELEGWRETSLNKDDVHAIRTAVKYPSNTSVGSDGSIRYCKKDKDDEGRFIEPSIAADNCDTFEIRYWSTDLTDIRNFLRHCYKVTKVKTNASCGFHIHVRFADMDKALAIFSHYTQTVKFLTIFNETFGNIPKYESRLRNMYCNQVRLDKERTVLKRQLEGEHDYRYRPINLAAYKAHGTIEFRMMPFAEDEDEAMKMIHFTVDTIEQLIKEFKVTAKDDEPIEILDAAAMLDSYVVLRNILGTDSLKVNIGLTRRRKMVRRADFRDPQRREVRICVN
jgi:hypothetical protein